MPSALESRQIQSSASIKPNRTSGWLKFTTHLRLLCHLSSTQEWELFQFLRHIFINFEWHEFTDLFEIQHADLEIFIFRNWKPLKFKIGIFCKVFCFENNLLYGTQWSNWTRCIYCCCFIHHCTFCYWILSWLLFFEHVYVKLLNWLFWSPKIYIEIYTMHFRLYQLTEHAYVKNTTDIQFS